MNAAMGRATPPLLCESGPEPLLPDLRSSVLSAYLFDLENQILKCAWWTAVDLRSRSAATFVPTWQALEVMGQHISAIMPVLGHVSAITPVLGYAVLGVVHSRPWNFEHGICGPLWDIS